MNPYLRSGDQAAQRKTYRFALDLMFGLLIIGLLIAAFLKQAHAFVDKARLMMVMAPAFEGRAEVIEHHALTGGWLDKTEPGEEVRAVGENARLLTARIGAIRQGAVHMEVFNRKRNNPQAPPEWWSIRPAVAADDAPTVLWVCGSRAPPAGFHALGENLTAVPPEVNFKFCQ